MIETIITMIIVLVAAALPVLRIKKNLQGDKQQHHGGCRGCRGCAGCRFFKKKEESDPYVKG